MRPTDDEIQAVRDLIISTCHHNPQFEAKGADALKVVNRLADASASAGSPKGQDTVGGLIGEADNIAVRDSGCANSSSPTHPISREAVAEKALGRFGHHPDPAIDFCEEVTCIDAMYEDHKRLGHMCNDDDTPADMDVLNMRIRRVMDFRAGGDPLCVAAKDKVRAIENALSLIGRAESGREAGRTPTNAMIAAGERALLEKAERDPEGKWWGYAKKVWLAMEAERIC